MGFTYPVKFTYLYTFVIQGTKMFVDNGGPTVHEKLVILCSIRIIVIKVRKQGWRPIPADILVGI